MPMKNGKNQTDGMMAIGQAKKSQHGNPEHGMTGKKTKMRYDKYQY